MLALVATGDQAVAVETYLLSPTGLQMFVQLSKLPCYSTVNTFNAAGVIVAASCSAQYPALCCAPPPPPSPPPQCNCTSCLVLPNLSANLGQLTLQQLYGLQMQVANEIIRRSQP